jgi:predicted Zn-dependent protease
LVFITRGLYDLAGADDNALAAVLAHEISHVTGRHALKIVSRSEFMSGTADLVSERSGDVAAVQSQLSQFDVGIGQLVNKLLETGFDPQTEFAADKAGHDLATTVGYAPGGLRGVLVRLQSKSAEPKAVFSTHPPLAERIKRLPDEPAS